MWWREAAMLLLFLCLLFCGISNGEHRIECATRNGTSFVEAEDGVEGRYRLEWCTTLDQLMAGSVQWDVSLRYNDWSPARCLDPSNQYGRWKLHSHILEDVTIDRNCSNACFSTNLDLIFNGTCYKIQTNLRVNSNPDVEQRFNENNYKFYVNNNYTKESFSNSQAVFKIYPADDHVEVHWYLHLVPAVNYSVDLCPVAPPRMDPECVDVTGNCSASAPKLTQVQCTLWPAPAPYSLRLRHNAPWTSGLSLFNRIDNCVLPSEKSMWVSSTVAPTVEPPPGASPWWALGGVLALALGGGAALLVCRSLLLRKLRERVRHDWRNRRQSEVAKAAGGGGGGGVRVLLLYARDCAPMMTVAAELRALLQLNADHVYDLYSPGVVREAARAPGEWLRRTLARPDVRVLLLQSPAAAALHAPAMRATPAGALTLERPLLGRRAAHRAPHGSDALLPMALRLLADSAHAANAYKKYYIATIAGLEAELVSEVTPQRRYSLPAAASLLLRDLAGPPAAAPAAAAEGEQHAQQLQRLTAAVRALHDHVRAHPDYLNDELIFFDYE